MYFCYLLHCSDGSLYTGITDNLNRRLKEHNQGKAANYTASRRPVRLVWSEPHATLSSARRREAQLKRWSHRKKKQLVAGFPRPVRQAQGRPEGLEGRLRSGQATPAASNFLCFNTKNCPEPAPLVPSDVEGSGAKGRSRRVPLW
ncbi:MAG: GIY-YIG nuclease family protein [Terriglobia bacterium]